MTIGDKATRVSMAGGTYHIHFEKDHPSYKSFPGISVIFKFFHQSLMYTLGTKFGKSITRLYYNMYIF